jgi:Htaa
MSAARRRTSCPSTLPFLTGDPALAAWSAEGGTLRLEGVPLTLTPEGAEAFGTYPAGEAFDPLTLELQTTEACAEAAVAARAGAPVAQGAIIAGAVLLGVAISIAVHLVLRARRRSRPAVPPPPAVP